MGCGQSKHDDVAAGNTIARKRSTIRGSRSSSKKAAVESVKDQSNNIDESKEGGNVKETDGAAEKADTVAVAGEAYGEEKKVGPVIEEAKLEKVRTEGTVAAPEKESVAVENVKVEEIKEEPATDDKQKIKEPVTENIVKVEEMREEAGKGEVQEKEATVTRVDEIKIENGAQEKVDSKEIKESPVVENVKVEETKAAAKDVEEEETKAIDVKVEEVIAEKDDKEKQNAGVEERATPLIQIAKVEEIREQAQNGKSENLDEKQQHQEPEKSEKATQEETEVSVHVGEDDKDNELNTEKEGKSGEESRGEAKQGEITKATKEEPKTA